MVVVVRIVIFQTSQSYRCNFSGQRHLGILAAGSLAAKGVIKISQSVFRSQVAFGGTNESIPQFPPAEKTLVAVYFPPRFLDVPDQHTVAPETVFVVESVGLAYQCGYDIRPDLPDPGDGCQISDRAVFFLVAQKNI